MNTNGEQATGRVGGRNKTKTGFKHMELIEMATMTLKSNPCHNRPINTWLNVTTETGVLDP